MRINRHQVTDTFLVAEANVKEKIMDQAKYFQDQLEEHNKKGQKVPNSNSTNKDKDMDFGDGSSDSSSNDQSPKANIRSFKPMDTIRKLKLAVKKPKEGSPLKDDSVTD